MRQFLFTKKYGLSAVHRHHNPALSMQENQDLFRKCSRTHGHDYKIEITLRGAPDAATGLMIQRQELDRIVQDRLLGPFTGLFLNDQVGNTSGEMMVEKFYSLLAPAFPPGVLVRIAVRETRKNSFSYKGEMHAAV